MHRENHMSRLAALRNTAAANVEVDPTIEVPVAVTDRDQLVRMTGLKTANEFQIDIFQHMQDQLVAYAEGRPTFGGAVEAVAGSGKTTTIVAAARLIPTHLSAIFLAFNKSIAEELEARLPRHVEAKTLNSLGFRYVRPYLSGIGASNIKLNSNRTKAIIRKELPFADQDAYGKDVAFMVNMCKSLGVAPLGAADAQGVNGLTATDEVLNDICAHHGRMVDIVARPAAYAAVRRVLELSFKDSYIYETNMIDYDDQKWLTVCKRPHGRPMAMPTYDIVIIDEVQDVNAVDIEMIKMVLKPNGIVIGVGDSKQAIYGFRGADTSAFTAFQTAFNAKTLPLSITYRCASSIVEHAQELVPTIQAAPNAIKGEVAMIDSYGPSLFQPKDMVLCRNNAPLVEFAYKLIQAGVPVIVKGRDIGQNLVRIIETCVAEKIWVPNPKVPGKKMPQMSVENATTSNLVIELQKWRDTQIDLIKIENPDDEDAIQRVDDQYNSVLVFARANLDNRVATLIVEIEAMFSDEVSEDAVICATIHKSKGLEADRVFMHRADCMYPERVRPGSWQYKQEQNLDYVARTRAKTFLGYLAKDGWN
jgi:DNA helicase-2/ATP-dependent DNA helicase PcrA